MGGGKYSFSYLVLSPSVKGVVRWEKGGYKGSFMGLELVKHWFPDAADAKRAVEKLAKRHLTFPRCW